jgi:hypothetical protein
VQNLRQTLKAELVEFMQWLADVDSELERKYDKVLWDLGEAVNMGNVDMFRKVKYACKADVLCSYRRVVERNQES